MGDWLYGMGLIKQVNILGMMEARFLTIREESYKYSGTLVLVGN